MCWGERDGPTTRGIGSKVSAAPREERSVLTSVGESYPPHIFTGHLLALAGVTVGVGKDPAPPYNGACNRV